MSGSDSSPSATTRLSLYRPAESTCATSSPPSSSKRVCSTALATAGTASRSCLVRIPFSSRSRHRQPGVGQPNAALELTRITRAYYCGWWWWVVRSRGHFTPLIATASGATAREAWPRSCVGCARRRHHTRISAARPRDGFARNHSMLDASIRVLWRGHHGGGRYAEAPLPRARVLPRGRGALAYCFSPSRSPSTRWDRSRKPATNRDD